MDKTHPSVANYAFGINLLKAILRNSKDKNRLVSPLSIQAALAMTHIGARERTAKEIGNVLATKDLLITELHHQFLEFLTRVQQSSSYYEIYVVNRIYVEKTFGIKDDFAKEIQRYYLADPVSVSFKEQYESVRKNINAWVAVQTKDKIKELLVSGTLTFESKMVIINALYFKGKWEVPFPKRETSAQPFRVSPNRTINTPTMTATHVYGFTTDSILGCSAVELPYKGNDFSMVIILPDDDFGLEALVQKLDGEKLDKLLRDVGKEKDTLQLSLPKFEMTSSFELKHPLSYMGMSDAFSTSADFSGITSKSKTLHLSDVIHKVYLRVDEQGTEAAAVTAVMMVAECAVESTPFVVDHPFLFVLVDRRFNNLLVFCGQITDPTLKE